MKKLTLYLIIFMLFACANEERQVEAVISSELTDCYGEWEKVIKEWKINGGMFDKSLLVTRKNIKGKNQTVFSRLVNFSWDRLEAEKKSHTIKQFGDWPISVSDFRNVTFVFEFDFSEEFPDKCKVLSWLEPIIWDELRKQGGDNDIGSLKFIEVPSNFNWQSPNAQKWTLYWLFANVN